MIPKIIHYCWFGGNPKNKLFDKCFKSWKKYCPDYEIIEWNEENFDISSCPLYVRQAYDAKMWAFVTDYVRLKVVYDCGGIYLDTDVELKKKIDKLLEHSAYFGFEDGIHVATGLGFGAVKGHLILKELMEDYEGIPFILENGEFDRTPCPTRNTSIFRRHGLKQKDEKQLLDDDILILPSIYLCPISYQTGSYHHSRKTISVHWFSASWQSENERELHKQAEKRRKRESRKDFFLHMPNRIVRKVIGKERYEQLKKFIKKFFEK